MLINKKNYALKLIETNHYSILRKLRQNICTNQKDNLIRD